jgi:hypothetical protein
MAEMPNTITMIATITTKIWNISPPGKNAGKEPET